MNDGQAYDEQGLPWLEAVDDEDGPRGVSARKMLAALLVVLARRGDRRRDLVLDRPPRRRVEAGGAPELIRAEPGPYKVKPDDPGGLDVAGDSGTAFATGAGEDRDAEIDLGRGRRSADRAARSPNRRRRRKTVPGNEAKEPVAPDAPAPPPSAGGSGSTIQLGFYDNPAQAEKAWISLSSRFSAVGAMSKIVVPYQQGLPAARQRGLARRRAQSLPDLEGGGRELLRGTLMQAAIYGLSGAELTDDERDFFRDADPAGYILFRRNCCDLEQLSQLTDALRDLSGRDDLPILIDQEGGRVARMQPPDWPAFPAAEAFDRLYAVAPSSAIEAARVNARAIALTLRAGRDQRQLRCRCSTSASPARPTSSATARSAPSRCRSRRWAGRCSTGMASAGVVGIIKHMPGHGRALVDSHKELPVVTASAEDLDMRPRAVRAVARRRRWG